MATERKPAEATSLERLVELVDEDFANFAHWWRLPRSRGFRFFFFGYCFALGVPLMLMFLVFLYVTDIQLGVAVIGIAIAFLAICFSFLNTSISSGVFDWLLKKDRFLRICRSEKFKPHDTARNKLLAWALISMRDRIDPISLAEAKEGAPSLLQDEVLLRDALLRE